MKEYMVNIWGGAFDEDAEPSIKKDLGITEGYYYFDNEADKDAFVEKLKDPKYYSQGIAICTEYGEMTHKKTIFVGTFEYLGKQYNLHYDFGYDYPADRAEFIFTRGNWSCDCNRSMLIRRKHGDDSIPQLDCGNIIKLVDYHIEYED